MCSNCGSPGASNADFRQWPTCGRWTPGRVIRRLIAMSATNRRQAAQIKQLQAQMATCCNGGGGDAEVTVWAADWNGSGYDVPATAPQDSIVLRIFTGPEPYDGPTWTGVRDLYFTTTDEA